MRHVTSWLIGISVVTGLGAGATSFAQPNVRDHRNPPPAAPPPAERDHRTPPFVGPTEAPPPPREERQAARAGFVWASGRWDWRGGKYEWVDGHWERERANKHWNPGRWDRQGDHWGYIEGGWVDGGGPPPPPPAGGPPPPAHDGRPHDAPPPPRIEPLPTARPGFVFIRGRWDWRGNKYEWVAGHWERERAGKQWREARWEQRDGAWALIDGDWVDTGIVPPGGPGPGHPGRPHQPPPPPREEPPPSARAGFVFVQGRWDWRGDKYEWVAGHWERERAGKQWREARWEQRDGDWELIDGDWVDVGSMPPPPPPMDDRDRDRDRDHHREWKLDRPMVSSYWPTKGKIGSRIVIHGRNFPADTAVLWGGNQINGARITPDEIVVAVPVGATSGTVSLRTGGRRELTVGNYEVADYDAAAEAQRQADEARRKAEQDWADRQRALAKDRAARQTAMDRHWQELSDTREQRRQDRLRELRARWEAAFLADTDTQSELTLHAQRVAELERMREVAELSENGKLVIRIGVATSREDQRHQDRMTALHDSFGRKL